MPIALPMALHCGCCGVGGKLTPAVRLRRRAAAAGVWAVVALAGVLLATVGHGAMTDYVVGQLRSAFVLTSPSAAQYGPWVNSGDPNAGIVFSFYYVSNVTNPAEVLAGGKPNIQEVGPLRYTYSNLKYNVSWEEDGDIVRYAEYQYYTPMDDATRALESTVVNTINVVLQGALHSPEAALIPDLFPSTKVPGALFTRRTVAEILWGYTDTVLGQAFPGLQSNDTSLAEALTQHQPTRMYTGKTTGSKAFNYREWDGESSLTCCSKGPAGEAGSVAPCAPAWPGYDGARVDGGFGTAFHMGIDPSETLHLAAYDFGIYRAMPFVCENVGGGPGPGDLYDGTALTASIGGCDSYDVQGIHLLKFTMPDWVFGNASKSPAEAAAYGITGPSGVLNQSVCEQGAPIMLSHPHFLYASDSVVNGVTGISPPDPELHGSFFGIDPVS